MRVIVINYKWDEELHTEVFSMESKELAKQFFRDKVPEPYDHVCIETDWFEGDDFWIEIILKEVL